MPIYEYECQECCMVSEHMSTIVNRQQSRTCKECGGVAHFIVSTPKISLDGKDPGFPGAYSKWEKNHVNWAKE